LRISVVSGTNVLRDLFGKLFGKIFDIIPRFRESLQFARSCGFARHHPACRIVSKLSDDLVVIVHVSLRETRRKRRNTVYERQATGNGLVVDAEHT
jgi:hypothetical protein